MLKRGLIIVGIAALLSTLFGCTKPPANMRDGPGMVYVPPEDMALFDTWTNEDESVQLIIEGDRPYMYIIMNGEQTFEAPVHVDTENGNVLIFERNDGIVTPVPYESLRIDLDNDVIYGVRFAENGDVVEDAFYRVSAKG